MKIICFAAEKGGVGKTMCAGNVAAALAGRGKKVLLVDMDPQCNLTTWWTGHTDHTKSSWDYCKNGSGSGLELRKNLEIWPANRELATAPVEMQAKQQKLFLLKKAALSSGADYVIIDTPPNFGPLVLTGLLAAHYVFIPISPSFFSLQGLHQIMETVEEIKETMNPGLKIGGIVINQFDGRKRLNKNVVRELREAYGDLVCKTVVRTNVSLDEATSEEQSIFEYSGKSNGAEDFKKLAVEIGRRVSNGKKR